MKINVIYSEINQSGQLYIFKAVESILKAQEIVKELNSCIDSKDSDKELNRIGAKYFGIYSFKEIELEDLWDLK